MDVRREGGEDCAYLVKEILEVDYLRSSMYLHTQTALVRVADDSMSAEDAAVVAAIVVTVLSHGMTSLI